MKSRISFFDKTVFLKNITRFAPAWGLYGVLLVLLILLTGSSGGQFAMELAYMEEGLSAITLPYALICAMLLFGDLYNPRMCNAIHALPLCREGLFFTNAISGLCFCLAPSLAALLLSLPLCSSPMVIGGWLAPVSMFAIISLEFLFFFGLATLCAFLVGSRFGLALVYSIVNALSMLVYALVDTLITPRLYGLRTLAEPFIYFCPAGQMAQYDYLEITRQELAPDAVQWTLSMGEGWGYLLLCAGLGLVCMTAAVLLYRRRKLECAGDLLAIRWCQPVFLVIYSLVMGVVFLVFRQLFLGEEGDSFLYIGIVVGVFTGQMLLRRTAQVFRLKTALWALVLAAGVALSLGITSLDPLGLVGWVPQATEVTAATITLGSGSYKAPGNSLTLEDPEDIARVLALHSSALEQKEPQTATPIPVETAVDIDYKLQQEYARLVNFALEYKLADGRVRSRYYTIAVASEAGDLLGAFLTRPECVLGATREQLPALVARLDNIQLDTVFVTEEAEMLSLLNAVADDCDAGLMNQDWDYRKEPNLLVDLQFSIELESGIEYWHYIQIYPDCESTVAWLRAHDIPLYEFDGNK